MQNTKGFGHGAAPKADVISFNTAISACEKASAWQTAMLLFLEMENLQYLSRFKRQRKQKVKIIYIYTVTSNFNLLGLLAIPSC